MDNIKGLLTTLGVTIVGNITKEDKNSYTVEKACFVNLQHTPNGVGLAITPATLLAPKARDGVTITINKMHIMFEHELDDEIKEKYAAEFSPIIKAPANTDVSKLLVP